MDIMTKSNYVIAKNAFYNVILSRYFITNFEIYGYCRVSYSVYNEFYSFVNEFGFVYVLL